MKIFKTLLFWIQGRNNFVLFETYSKVYPEYWIRRIKCWVIRWKTILWLSFKYRKRAHCIAIPFKDGNWSDSGMWLSKAYPQSHDTVIIPKYSGITLLNDAECDEIIIDGWFTFGRPVSDPIPYGEFPVFKFGWGGNYISGTMTKSSDVSYIDV